MRGDLQRRSVWIPVAILSVAALLRLAGAGGDLWLDEIWSIDIAREAGSLLGVFAVHHDNNHPLNTIWLLSAGGSAHALWLRLPAVIAGVASVALAGIFVGRKSRAGGLAAMILTASSYLLVLYGSEARGYGLAVFFTLLALVALDRQLERPAPRWAALFQLAVILALFSHLTAIPAYAAMAAWGLLRHWRASPGVGRALEHLLVCHALPVVAVLGLYFFFVSDIEIGGGPLRDPMRILRRSLALALGIQGPGTARVGAGLTVAVLLSALVLLARRGSDRWILYTLAIVGMPLLPELVGRPGILAPRYFLLPIVFFLLMLGEASGELWPNRRLRVAVAFAIMAFCALNARPIQLLLDHGRGQYRNAMRYMAERGGPAPILVAGDHDFRISRVLAYHALHLPGLPALVYRPQGSLPPEGTVWFLRHRPALGRARAPVEVMTDEEGNRYLLEQSWPSAPVSGLHWFLYRNERVEGPGE